MISEKWSDAGRGALFEKFIMELSLWAVFWNRPNLLAGTLLAKQTKIRICR
jgi:hypothetical protein